MTSKGAGPGLVRVELAPDVTAAFTTSSANLAPHVGDDPAAARRALRTIEDHVGAPLVRVVQVHGADVHVVGPGAPGQRDEVHAEVHDEVNDEVNDEVAGPAVRADALVTTRDDVALAVLVADCVPVLLADPRGRVVAAVHAGRRGVVADVVGRAVEAMTGLGARPRDVRAVVGPAACGRCYEVPPALRDEVGVVVPGAVSTTSWGTPALDLPRAVVERLRAHGVTHVRDTAACTIEDATWFSHRGATGGSRPAGSPTHRPEGRFAGVVRLAPACREGASGRSG